MYSYIWDSLYNDLMAPVQKVELQNDHKVERSKGRTKTKGRTNKRQNFPN